MRTVIPPHYLELVADAALKSYWRKRALRLFLRRCGVSETFLATWHTDESKRDFLYRLFPKLEDSGNDGLRLVHRMADALIQQSSFPDLVGWEDSVQKVATRPQLSLHSVPIGKRSGQKSLARGKRPRQGRGRQRSVPRSGHARMTGKTRGGIGRNCKGSGHQRSRVCISELVLSARRFFRGWRTANHM